PGAACGRGVAGSDPDKPGCYVAAFGSGFDEYHRESDNLQIDRRAAWEICGGAEAGHVASVPNGRYYQGRARVVNFFIAAPLVLTRCDVRIVRRVTDQVIHTLFRRTGHLSGFDAIGVLTNEHGSEARRNSLAVAVSSLAACGKLAAWDVDGI